MEKSEKIWNWRFILLFITNLLVLAAFYASIPIIPVYCEEIVETQDPNAIDIASGASNTLRGFQAAVEDALSQA